MKIAVMGTGMVEQTIGALARVTTRRRWSGRRKPDPRPPRVILLMSRSSANSFSIAIVDLGDITAARGTEMVLPVWIRLWKVMGTGAFNLKIAR